MSNPSSILENMGTVSEQQHSVVVITLVYNPEGPQIESHEEPTTFCQMQISAYTFFWVMQIICFDQKIKNDLKISVTVT